MKNKSKDCGYILAVSLFLLICRNQGLSADLYFGYYNGYSLALNCQRFYAQFFPKESIFGFSVEVFKQAYDAVVHSERAMFFNGIKTAMEKSSRSDKHNFWYIMIGSDYRFFADIDKKFNPYLNLSFMALCYINIFGGDPPSYPDEYDLKCGAGIKYKLIPGILLNTNLSYFVGNSILSLQMGAEFCF